MCHKLLQVYACGHLKTICITPCPHAIATGLQVPDNHENTPELSRSSSVVSSMTSSSTALPTRRSDVQGLPSQRARDAQAHASPLRAAVLSGQARQQQQGGGNTPAFRFVTPGTAQETMGNGLEYVQTHPASPASQSPTSPTSPSSNHPSPTLSTTGTLIDAPLTTYTPSPSAFFTLADPEIDTSTVVPNFCAYYFPRYLPHSELPCLGCYSNPEWKKYRDAWMKVYREQHPGFKEEDVEVLSGVNGVREQFGG